MCDDQKQDVNVDGVLEDGVVTNAVLMQLSEDFRQEEETEKMINGPLSMVCTYPEGYKERQAVYSCLTCQEETGKLAGVCYACSENCHADHDLVQLYTKRNFCCDCGNSKFNSKCKLFEEKIPINRKNTYNHNFRDEYCTCNKSYPPPENDSMYSSEMFQCIGCEDWFHAEHLGLKEEIFEEGEVEVVCAACVIKLPFLRPYSRIYEREFVRVNGPIGQKSAAGESETNGAPIKRVSDLIVENKDEEKPSPVEAPISSMFAGHSSTQQTGSSVSNELNQTSTSSGNRRKLVIIDNRESTADSTMNCYYQEITSPNEPEVVETAAGSLWFGSCDWRLMLCRCQTCKRMYEDAECEFLLEDSDTLTHYLNMNAAEMEKNRREPEDEIFDEVAKRTNVDVAHTVVAEVAVLKRKLVTFLNDMAKNDKTVTDDDVRNFFGELNAKRQRLDQPAKDENEDED